MTYAESRLLSVGITPCLLSNPDLSGLSALSLPLTNGIVLDLHYFMSKSPTYTYHSLKNWMAALLATKWPKVTQDQPTVKALRQSVLRLSNRLARFKKEHNSEVKAALIASFLDENYCLPSVFLSRGKFIKSKPVPVASSSSSSDWEKERLELVNQELCKELSDQSSELEQTEKKLQEMRLGMHSKHRNFQKKVKRRDHKLEQRDKEVKKSKCLIKGLEKNLKERETSNLQLRNTIDRLRHRSAYWKAKCGQVKESSSDEMEIAIAEEKAAQVQLSEKVDALEDESLELCETVEKLLTESEEIATFERGKYLDNIRACCYELLSFNVGVKNIEKVIRSVLSNMTGKSISRLPSKTTLCDMMIESLTVAQAQLAEKLTETEEDYFTIHTDGTTKHGEHFGAFDVTTKDETYHLGLRHIFSGSAQTTLDTLLEILEDFDTVCKASGSKAVSNKILCRLKNTMSDRHAAEKLFCQLLAEYREGILPDFVSNWNTLSADEQCQMTRMNNFFCGLHYLVGLADTAEATLKLWESIEGETPGTSSGTQRLIRTACKAFHSRGCEKSGCSVHFRTYLRSQGVSKIPMADFRGNRFNIIFYDLQEFIF